MSRKVVWCRNIVPKHVPSDRLLHYRGDHGHEVLTDKTVRFLGDAGQLSYYKLVCEERGHVSGNDPPPSA